MIATAAVLGLMGLEGHVAPQASPPARPSEDRPIYIVSFSEAPLATYGGGVPGLAPTRPGRGRHRLDPSAPASRAYLQWIDRRHEGHLAAIAAALGRQAEAVFRYRAAGNGVALRLRAEEAARLAKVPGVVEIVPDRDLPLATDRGPEFIGARAVWEGSTGAGTEGEGVVIGVLDTGINMDHPSFSDAPIDGHIYTNPLGQGRFVGWCDPANPNYDPRYVCNNKLIGAWDFVDAVSGESDGPDDGFGHGSHTASTTAGNHVDYNGDGLPDLSGVAPHANLITYDVCTSACPASASMAAVDQVILDGVVDVLNYSISETQDPWSFSSLDRFFLNAVAAGIFVATTAGNRGAGGVVEHQGPWVTNVGASTHDRVAFRNALVGLSGGAAPQPGDIAGLSRSRGYGPAPIVFAGAFRNGDPNPEQCLRPFRANTWRGEIVLCDRGGITRVMKGQNVLAGGAGGMVLANVPGGADDLVDEAHVLPAIHVDAAAGDMLRAWLASGSRHSATITDGSRSLDSSRGDIIAGFSSRRLSTNLDVLKPDLVAPGVGIYAATRNEQFDVPGLPPYQGPAFQYLEGTSMSSPHVAGAAALVAAVHPDWTPPQVQSALMTTALTTVRKNDGAAAADPQDMGSGRVDVSRAIRAGLLLDESEANFLAANPAAGGDPRTLNIASLMARCGGVCSWTRTVENPLDRGVTWTASAAEPGWLTIDAQPSSFTLAPGGSQALTVEVRLTGSSTSTWTFGQVDLTPDDPEVPPAHIPLAVLPVPDLRVAAWRISDAALGNNDGVVDPSEIVTVEVDLRNDGAAASSGVNGTLSTTTPGVSILDPEAVWVGPIEAGSTQTSRPPHFLVRVGQSVPCGTDIELVLDAHTVPGPSRDSFQIPVGTRSPSGSLCRPVPCVIGAVAQAVSSPICSGTYILLSAAGSLEAGDDCSGALEYRFEDGASVVQDWSSDPDVFVAPTATTTYVVRVRDQGTPAEDVEQTVVNVIPAPEVTVVQTPSAACPDRDTTVTLTAVTAAPVPPGEALFYFWHDPAHEVVGAGPQLSLPLSACGRRYTLFVRHHTANGVVCGSEIRHDVSCCDTPLLFGQREFFETGCNRFGRDASSLCSPTAVEVDGAGNLYVADRGNHRVLIYRDPVSSDNVADVVVGQPDFFTGGCNTGGLGPGSLCSPTELALDAAGNLYVAELANNRVLVYFDPLGSDTVADVVVGQPDFVTGTCNTGGLSAGSLCSPSGVAVDGQGNLYVGEFSNHRVLVYLDPLTADGVADRVIGQPDFVTNTCNTGGRSASSMCVATGVDVDASGNLYVSDTANDRVLEFDNPLTMDSVADRVFGQINFTEASGRVQLPDGSTACGTPSPTSLCDPRGVAVDAGGNLLVADSGISSFQQPSSRVLRYFTPLVTDTVADVVIGQPDLTSAGCNGVNGIAQFDTLCGARGVAVSAAGSVFIADTNNSRVLGYPPDEDGDGLNDLEDPCPDDTINDPDLDEVCGRVDNCPGVANADQADVDGDGIGDACDPCPSDPDNDADADTVCGDVDACPSQAPAPGLDADHNGCTDTLAGLRTIVESLSIRSHLKSGLLAKLDEAQKALDHGNTNIALNKLHDFIAMVEGSRERGLSASDADLLVAYANNLIRILSP